MYSSESSFHYLDWVMPEEHFKQQAKKLIETSMATQQALLDHPDVLRIVAAVAETLIAAFRQGNKILLFGNGGSAADAQHIAAEFVGRMAFDRRALPALAFSVNGSTVTAIANDHGFEQVFSRQLEAFARPGDVAVGISTSGNSPNVIRAMATAHRSGLKTVGLTGASGGKLASHADLCICVPSNETPRIQECHILIGHIIAELVEREIFREEGCVPRS